MKILLIVIFIFTVMDTVLTCIGIDLNYITECNPLLRSIYEFNSGLAAILIPFIVALLLMVIYIFRFYFPWIKYGLCGLLAVKLYILYLHFSWIKYVI